MSENNDKTDNLDTVKNVWIILNSILVVYALILFCYGKYFRHKDSLSYVIHNLYNIYFYFYRKV